MSTSFKYKKGLGQHFLRDANTLKQIIQLINPTPEFHWIEIGPGSGALTRHLLPLVKSLDAIEIDKEIIPKLQHSCETLGALHIYQQDALKFDFETICKQPCRTRLVGNLPYNISTPLLFHLFKYHGFFKDMHFMLQKEVAERITAQPGKKSYGRLSIMTQWYCQTELLLEVPNTAFYPTPQVDSAIIKLTPHLISPFGTCDVPLLSKIVTSAFNQRRKTLKNSLKKWLTEEDWEELRILSQKRAENLSVQDFVNITKFDKFKPAS